MDKLSIILFLFCVCDPITSNVGTPSEEKTTMDCYKTGVDYKGYDINNGLGSHVPSAAACQVECQMTHGCNYFTWVSPSHSDSSYRNTCWLKSTKGTPDSCASCMSGLKLCGGENCCERITLDSTGMGDFYQGDRLGRYTRCCVDADGRPIYRQDVTGDNYLFYQADSGVWMVGSSIGQTGGIRNKEDGECPYNLEQYWEYYRDWTSSWEEDWTLEATCEFNPTSGPDPTLPPDAESCTWGAACDGCNIWSEVNGVRYCCAQNCNTGTINVSTENGEVICWCTH